MNPTKPECGHSSLSQRCRACRRFQQKWYAKVQAADKDWHDIEYGLENAERLYEPVDVDKVDSLTTDYYDRVLDLHHQWVNEGRRKRDCVIALLLGSQDKTSGTERGISEELRRRRLRPTSRFTVRQTIAEINAVVLKIAQGGLSEEQAGAKVAHALYLLDSKPTKDEANGKTETERREDSNSAAA